MFPWLFLPSPTISTPNISKTRHGGPSGTRPAARYTTHQGRQSPPATGTKPLGSANPRSVRNSSVQPTQPPLSAAHIRLRLRTNGVRRGCGPAGQRTGSTAHAPVPTSAGDVEGGDTRDEMEPSPPGGLLQRDSRWQASWRNWTRQLHQRTAVPVVVGSSINWHFLAAGRPRDGGAARSNVAPLRRGFIYSARSHNMRAT